MTAPADADGPWKQEDELKRMIVRASGARRSLSAAYVLELRRLIHEDAYKTVHVADEIARRMLHQDL